MVCISGVVCECRLIVLCVFPGIENSLFTMSCLCIIDNDVEFKDVVIQISLYFSVFGMNVCRVRFIVYFFDWVSLLEDFDNAIIECVPI